MTDKTYIIDGKKRKICVLCLGDHDSEPCLEKRLAFYMDHYKKNPEEMNPCFENVSCTIHINCMAIQRMREEENLPPS